MKAIRKSIFITYGILFALQITFFEAVRLIIPPEYPKLIVWSFYGAGTVFHAGILFALVKFESYFYTIPDEYPLKRVNTANVLTLIRITSVPTICCLVVINKYTPIGIILFVSMAAVFLTDFFDGIVSRLSRKVTAIGKMLDSTSDYSLLLVITIAYYLYQLIPLWFFILILIRGAIMIIGNIILRASFGEIKRHSTFLGKASIFALMAFYSLIIIEVFLTGWTPIHQIVLTIQYIVGVLLLLSLIDKVIMFQRMLTYGKGHHL